MAFCTRQGIIVLSVVNNQEVLLEPASGVASPF